MTDSSVTTTGNYPRARWWAVVGIVSAVLGIALCSAWFIWGLGQVDDGVDDLVLVTGGDTTELVVETAVDWTIYLEPSSRSLSGVRFQIVDTATGEAVQLQPARNDVVYDVGDRGGRPVSRALLEPGTYRVELSPDDATLAIGPDVGDRVQQLWLGVVVIALPTVLGGGVVAAVNMLRVLRGRPTAGSIPAPAAEPASVVAPPDPPPPSGPVAGPPGRGDPPSNASPPVGEVSPPRPAGPPPLAPPSGPPTAVDGEGVDAPPAAKPPLPPPDPAKRRDR